MKELTVIQLEFPRHFPTIVCDNPRPRFDNISLHSSELTYREMDRADLIIVRDMRTGKFRLLKDRHGIGRLSK